MKKEVIKKKEIKKTKIEEVVDKTTQEEKDLAMYESLMTQLVELGIRSISDLENLIATTKQKM